MGDHLYFDSTICGADAVFDESAGVLTYKSRVSTTISSSSSGGILLNPVMTSTELTCKYAQSVDGSVNIKSIAAFTGADVIFVESFIMNGDEFESVTTDVTLGAQMKVAFSVSNKDMPIYVKNCKAKKDAATANAVDFYIVENGCDKPIAQIEPKQKAASCTAEKCSVELWFEQFGFVVSGTTESVTMTFIWSVLL